MTMWHSVDRVALSPMRQATVACTRREMTITPLELPETSIAQLRLLVAFLDDQLSDTNSAEVETRGCHEIARSLRLLISTHQVPRCEAPVGEQCKERLA